MAIKPACVCIHVYFNCKRLNECGEIHRTNDSWSLT